MLCIYPCYIDHVLQNVSLMDVGEISDCWHRRYSERDMDMAIEQTTNDPSFQETKSCILIGPGSGFVEMLFIRQSLPKLERLIVIEVDQGMMKKLENKFQQELPNVTKQFYVSRMQDWKGPDEKVDLVMAIDSFYEDHVKLQDRLILYRQIFQEWLKPGGCLFVGQDDDRSVYNTMLSKLYPDYKRTPAQEILEEVKQLNIQSVDHFYAPELDLTNVEDGFLALFLHNDYGSLIDINVLRNVFKNTFTGKSVKDARHFIKLFMMI